MGEGDLAGVRWATTADEAGDRDRVMRRAHGTIRDETARRWQESGYAPDRRHLENLVAAERGKDPGQPTRQHRLTSARGAHEDDVVGARRCDFEGAFGVGLAA